MTQAPPPPRDPRMVHAGEGVSFTEGEAGATWSVPDVVLRRWRLVAVATTLVMMGLGGAVALMVPRMLAYDGLLEENLALRGRVEELDRRMAEVDRILMRLRIYDAQLKGLTPDGDHGPLGDIDEPPPPDDDGPWSEVDLGAPLDAHGELLGLRPADAWADAVIARADNFLAVFEEAEPDLNLLVAELEDLRSLDQALPSVWPASGHLTSDFGYRRSPFGRRAQFHKGIDISNERNAPISAAAPGRVLRAFFNAGYGRFIEIDHGYGITTRYAHLNRILVQEGDEVEQGQLIGGMGRTGRVTGTHLHFEVRIDGHAVDPLDYLPR